MVKDHDGKGLFSDFLDTAQVILVGQIPVADNMLSQQLSPSFRDYASACFPLTYLWACYISLLLTVFCLEDSEPVWMRQRYRTLNCLLLLLFPVILFAAVISLRSAHFYLEFSSIKIQPATFKSRNSAYRTSVVRTTPPRVDRSILDKLRSLDAEECLTEVSSRTAWPPKVTRLPIEISPRQLRDTALDIELCGFTSCRLLLPAFIGEQESKARRHLLQLAHLAHVLNRTLVLPNVARSRLGTCAKWEFALYYESPDVPGKQVSFGAFRRWVALRAARPRVQVVEVLPVRPASTRGDAETGGQVIFSVATGLRDLGFAEVTISASRDPAAMAHNHCLRVRARNAHFGDFSPVDVYPNPSASASATASMRRDDWFSFGQGLVAALSSPVIAAASKRANVSMLIEPDVLLLNWELRHAVFPLAPDITLAYARRWMDVATSLATRLQPFIAVHWRMERVLPSALPSCAPLLVATLSALLTDTPGITAVYLATDYPTEGTDAPHSGTFRVGEEHHVAMRRFERMFAEADAVRDGGVRLTGFVSELGGGGLGGMSEEGEESGVTRVDLDAGLMGIVDKMVATQATLFVSGGPSCGKTR